MKYFNDFFINFFKIKKNLSLKKIKEIIKKKIDETQIKIVSLLRFRLFPILFISPSFSSEYLKYSINQFIKSMLQIININKPK